MQYSDFIEKFLNKFETIRSFAKKIEFANTYLNRIGSGSGRIVYDIDGTKVFKIAKNSKGIAQNEIESSIGRDYMAEHIVTEVFESADDNSWLIAEKGKKVNERRIKELTDISSLVNLGNYLYNSTVYNSRFKRPVSDDVLENLKNNEFVIDLLEFVYNFGQSIGDMSRPSSYGEVVRDGQPMIVLTDYGLNDEVYQTHYSGQRKNRVYELYNFGDGNDDILSDIGGGEDIRKGMWAIIPYSVSDGDAVINEKIIKFITENTDFTNKINGAVVDSFHYVVENIKEYLNKSKNKKQFYENLLNMQEILINNGLYDRDRLEKINDGNVLGENIMTSGFTRKISDKIALDIVKNKGYDVLGYIGKGKHGYAYEITGGKILKITTDESEAKQSYKIKNLTLNTIVNIFDVFKINIGKDNKLIVFGIVLEKLKTDPNYFRKMYERLSSITKKIFKKDIYDILDIYRIFKDYYLESIKDRLNSYLSKYPEDAKFFNSLLKICDDLKKLNIDTTEYYSIHNLGFKPNGSLAVFDIGFGAIDFETSMETVFVNEFGGDSLYSTRNSIGNDNLPTYNNDNIVNERKLTFMKNSSSVNVKKKCKLGGLGNTSAACNQGDINNLEIKSINEEIDASEAHTDNGVLNAIANGKKNVGIIALKNKPHIEKIVSDLGLNLLPVKQLKHDVGMTIIYTDAGKEDAKKLYDFMISKGGYVEDETPKEAYFLGKIFGYSDKSINDYIERSIKRGRYKKKLVNETNKNTLLAKKNYKLRYPNKNLLIFVSADKLLARHKVDQPDYSILNIKNRIGNRVEKAKDFINKYSNDNRWIDARTGKRSEREKAVFEPSIVGIYNNKLSFEDGRHRVLAAKELGYEKVPIEIPKSQLDIFIREFDGELPKNDDRDISLNEIKKKAPLTYTGESFYFDPTKIKDNQWIQLTKILTKMGWADRPYTDWKNFFLTQGSQTIPGDYLDTDNENDLSKIIAIKKIITPKEKPTEEKSYITKAKRYFGITNEYIFGGYILLDGTMLDFSGRKQGNQYARTRVIDHREINIIGVDMVGFMAMGNIRISHNNGIDLTQMPTNKQFNTLRGFLNSFTDTISIDFTRKNSMSVDYSIYYPKNTNINRILNDIIRYYRDGIKPVAPLIEKIVKQ